LEARLEVNYAQLLETNNLMQVLGDESYWLCFTRTTQESKLIPVSSYILLSYVNAFYRYPSLLRKIEGRLTAEQCGDRARNMGSGIHTSSIGWCLPAFYLLGREWLINMGLLRPEDAVEDVTYVLDFWKRVQLSYHRNDGHRMNSEFGHRSQILPERILQVFEADLFPITPGSPLHAAANRFMATLSQFQFLSHCECRLGAINHGPYRLGDNRELIVRDFLDVGEGDYAWLDGIVTEVPYANLTVPMVLKDTHCYLMDDWGSFEAEPEFRAENLIGIGLYTSDPLSEGYIPVSMESPEDLQNTFNRLQAVFAEATVKLWGRMAQWSRAQLIEAGALVYFSIPKELAHVAGVYDQSDWMEIDERALRFIPLLNDEYGRDCLTELVGTLTLPSQQGNEYMMAMHNNAAKRMMSPVPYAVLTNADWTKSSGGLRTGSTVLERKTGKWQTARGLLTLSAYNEAARNFTPAVCAEDLVFTDDAWLKYHSREPQAEKLYRLTQANSRHLKGKGANLKRDGISCLTGNRW
jgi:hypothetical protein